MLGVARDCVVWLRLFKLFCCPCSKCKCYCCCRCRYHSGLQVDELQEFGNEVRVLRALTTHQDYHQGVLQFYGVSRCEGEIAPRLFMVMEWCAIPMDEFLQKHDQTPMPGLPNHTDRNWVRWWCQVPHAKIRERKWQMLKCTDSECSNAQFFKYTNEFPKCKM